jgi:hypothetical protein
VGDDPDHELFFNPLKADVQAVAVFVAAWRGEPAPLLPDLSERDGTPTARPADLLGPLGLTRVDCRFDDAIAGHWPAPLNPMLFIDRRSRLFLER